VWARIAMGWHRPELTETDVLTAVVADVFALLPGVDGAAVLSGRSPGFSAGSGGGKLLAVSGTLPGLAGPRRPGAERAGLLRTGQLANGGRERDGWAIAVTPAPTGHGMLMWTPLGRGRMCRTLLIAAAGAVSDRLESSAVTAALHAAPAIAAAEQREQLQIAVDGRDVVGQATGIVMARLQVSADAALGLLVRASQYSNVTVQGVCAGVCATGDLDDLIGASS
jgi:hypothetical protein